MSEAGREIDEYLETLWQTVKEDMPRLKRTVRDVLEKLERGLKP